MTPEEAAKKAQFHLVLPQGYHGIRLVSLYMAGSGSAYTAAYRFPNGEAATFHLRKSERNERYDPRIAIFETNDTLTRIKQARLAQAHVWIVGDEAVFVVSNSQQLEGIKHAMGAHDAPLVGHSRTP